MTISTVCHQTGKITPVDITANCLMGHGRDENMSSVHKWLLGCINKCCGQWMVRAQNLWLCHLYFKGHWFGSIDLLQPHIEIGCSRSMLPNRCHQASCTKKSNHIIIENL